jgi:hypothetical protein
VKYYVYLLLIQRTTRSLQFCVLHPSPASLFALCPISPVRWLVLHPPVAIFGICFWGFWSVRRLFSSSYRSVLLTLILFAALALAYTRTGYEWAATLIERQIQDTPLTEDDCLPPSLEKRPTGSKIWWYLSLVSIALAGLVFFVSVWWVWWLSG